jgi:Fic family protein
MSRVMRLSWTPNVKAPSRTERRACSYEAYIPDRLVGRQITLDGSVAAEVADAEAAVARLDTEAAALIGTEALARMLLRAESVASSKIEGLEIGARRLLRAEAARTLGDDVSDVTAAEVLGSIDAMAFAIESVDEGDPISSELFLEIHRRLFAGSRLAEQAGRFRNIQNWIGGSDFNPCSAAFVPPPPEYVGELMSDLLAFTNDDSLPAVAQAAIAHAHFETIHPFIDGNGRTGRALIHMILRRRGLARRVVVPVSLILATWAKDYVAGLAATRYRGPARSREAHQGLNLWVGRFAAASKRAVHDARSFEERARELELQWRQRVGRVRANSATDVLIRAIVGAPVLTVNSASELIQRSFVQTNEAVTRLAEAGILQQVNVGRRNRAFESPEVISAFTDLERQLASPGGDTHTSEPLRRVPRRRQLGTSSEATWGRKAAPK